MPRRRSATIPAGRITLDAAFQQRLQRGEEPYAAVEGLNVAIRTRKIRLWYLPESPDHILAPGSEVRPDFFASHMHVVVRLAPDGRATAEMAMLRAVEGWNLNWMVSGDGMEPVKNGGRSTWRRRPGPKPTANWQTHVRGEIKGALRRGEPIPPASDLADCCTTNLGYTPDVSAINKLIKDMIKDVPG